MRNFFNTFQQRGVAAILAFMLIVISGCNFSFVITQQPNLTVTSIAPIPTILLSWTASANSPQNYKIEQSTDNINFTLVQTVGKVTSTTISGLKPKTRYYYRIKASNPAGDSIYSDVVNITTR